MQMEHIIKFILILLLRAHISVLLVKFGKTTYRYCIYSNKCNIFEHANAKYKIKYKGLFPILPDFGKNSAHLEVNVNSLVSWKPSRLEARLLEVVPSLKSHLLTISAILPLPLLNVSCKVTLDKKKVEN